jgi:hypothetical protein
MSCVGARSRVGQVCPTYQLGKKARITPAIGPLAGVIAWADGDINTTALPAAVSRRGAGLLHPGPHRQRGARKSIAGESSVITTGTAIA